MQNNTYQWIQWLKYKIFNLWDTSVSLFCISIVVLVLSVVNVFFLYLLALSICIDALIWYYATFYQYKNTFDVMRKDYFYFTKLENIDGSLKKLYISEARRFKLFQEGNRFGTKCISAYVSKELDGLSTSYSFFSDESIILLHKDFDGEEDIDRFTFLHEIGHCIGHSLIEQKRLATRFQSVLLVLIIVASSVVLQSLWIFLCGLLFLAIMLFCSSRLYVKSRIEMGADAIAVTIYEHLYGKENMNDIVQIFTKRYCDEILVCKLGHYGFLLNAIFSISRFMSANDKNKFIAKLDERISYEEESPTGNNRKLLQRLKAIRKHVMKSPQLDTFMDGILTWNPILYYIVFLLLMILAWHSASQVFQFTSIPWWCMLLCTIPIVAIIWLRREIGRATSAKSAFTHNILNKQNL